MQSYVFCAVDTIFFREEMSDWLKINKVERGGWGDLVIWLIFVQSHWVFVHFCVWGLCKFCT